MEQLIKVNPVAFSLVIPALISICIGVYSFTKRSVLGAKAVGFLMLALYAWSLFYGLELSCLTLDGMMLSATLAYLGIATAPVLLLIVALQYTGRESWVTPAKIILLFIIPLMTIMMVATNHLHHFFYISASVDSSRMFPMLALTWGPWFWVHTAYSYIMLMISIFLLASRLGKRGSVFYNQAVAMLIALSLPCVMNIIYVVFQWMPFGHLDMTPFAFSVTGVVIAWSIFQYGLFDITPTAHDVIVDGLDDIVVVLDGQNRIVECNKRARKILGLSRTEIGLYATAAWKEWPGLIDLAASNRSDRVEFALNAQDIIGYYEAFAYKIPGLPEHSLRKVITLHDISGMKQAEWALRQSEEKYRMLIEHSHDVIYTMTTEGILTFVSPAWTELLGHQPAQVIGQPFYTFIHAEDIEVSLEVLREGLIKGQPVKDFEYRVRHIDGSWRWHTTSAVPLRDDVGTITGIEGISHDITERKQMEQKLQDLATHDFLTGLPNRVLLIDRFTIAAALAQRNKTSIAIMSLDLDNFKPVNDIYGHDAGDHVLQMVSTRLSGVIRASDTLARVGGDEFILVMMVNDAVEDASAAAQKILDSFNSPLAVDGHDIHLNTSIGISIYPDDAEDLAMLIKKSDAAMYCSKRNGRGRFTFYNEISSY